jgi:serine/threonine protein kinase
VSPRLTCPDRATLEHLLAGGPVPASDALFAHVEQCPKCAESLQQLAPSDTLPDLIRAGVTLASADPSAVEPLVRRVLNRHADPTDTVTSPTKGAADDATADVLAVLSPPQSDGEIGRLGGYRVLKVLGHGGMGAVFQGEDPRLGRLVALKVMLPAVARKPGMTDRFLREARAAAALDHDHVVPVYEVNEANGVPYIAMPFLRGGTLAERLKDVDGPLPAGEVAAVGRQIASGLAAAHARGLVHRDIKPANVWLDAAAGGRAKILDFGLARSDADHQLTHSGAVLGTPSYMAPEQARGEAVDGRADLFSLGCVLYRMATGRLPFRGDNVLSALASLASDTPPSVRELNPAVPPKLADLIHRLLAKDPAVRPSSAERVITELDTPSVPVSSERKRRPWLPVAIAAVALGLAGVGFGVFQFVFQTKDGTLVVETGSEEADVRFKKGKLEVYDADGKLAYTLKPSEKNKTLPPGQYTVEVVGADGLKVETKQFEMTKGGVTTVRVTAEPAKVALADPPNAATATADAIPDFPGNVVFRDTFDSQEKCKLPLADGPPVKKEVTDGKYVVSKAAATPTDVLTAEIGPRVKVGAFAMRARTEGGQLFVNFRDRHIRESNVRWHALLVGPLGAQSVALNRRNWDKTRWGEVGQSVLQSAPPDPARAAGQWVTFAARWSETEYEVWVNGQRVAGGAADPAEVTAATSPVQVCVRPAGDGPAKMELEFATVWDQTGLPVSGVGPNVSSVNLDTLRWVLSKRKPGTGNAARIVADGKPVWLEPGSALPTGDFAITAVDLHRMYSEPITDDDLKRIAALISLKKLNVGAQPITAAGLKHLKGLTELNELDLWGQSPEVAGELVRGFEKLEMMCLPGDHADEWVELLAGMKKLRFLYCTHGKLSMKGVAGFRNLPALTAITLDKMEERLDAFLPELAKNDRLRSISFGVVGDATKVKIDEFAKRVPACEIRYTHAGKEVVLPAGRK